MTKQFMALACRCLIIGAVLAAGCKSAEEREREEEASTLRLHLEENPDGTGRNYPVAISSEEIAVNIHNTPFLTEIDIDRADVVPARGGFAIKIQFNRHGTWILENMTTSYKGRRIAVFSDFGEARWLGAPVITKAIADGQFVFTPDATREEAERIVRGLNNIVREIEKRSRF